MSRFGGREMSTERKKQIAERMKSFLKKPMCLLLINRSLSIKKMKS